MDSDKKKHLIITDPSLLTESQFNLFSKALHNYDFDKVIIDSHIYNVDYIVLTVIANDISVRFGVSIQMINDTAIDIADYLYSKAKYELDKVLEANGNLD